MKSALSLSVLALGGAASPQTPGLTLEAARGLSTRTLAARLLTPPLASGVVAHRLRPSGPSSGAVEFLRAPVRAGVGVCRREGLYAPLAGGAPVRFVEIALTSRCPIATDARYARVQPAAAEPGAVAALQTLADLRARTRARGKPPVPVRCRSDAKPDPCRAGEQAVMRDLPIEAAYLVERSGEGWRFALMPTGPGQLYWDTRLIFDGERRMRVELEWKAPAPF
jgi:hypothetical protein